ncbi:hypothetical protein E2P81_ATG11729 [Venturia nashicola]|uniref:Telomere replication protein EST3 n=1 Tax=Venturia nashicola TaxID=86259 RepID=A0A4Z1P1N3_9PEZI|nr:hypothetical protein E6O75_ATG11419 [Venturia nashicola]TLD18819.1 hypothetical protein E2P81_ATG11729 [Venturia nashicola]
MASSPDNWLGPKLEQELKNVVAWKKHDSNQTTLSTSATGKESVYSYDGSNLWMKVEYAIEEPVLVQVQQFTKTKHPFNCLISDGFTTVRAKFSKVASESLQSHPKIDNLARLSNQALLNVPRFRVMIAPSGPEADRVQLLIDYVGIVNEKKVAALGNPETFHMRPGVIRLLHQAEQLMHPASEAETPAPEPVPTPRTRVIKNGQYTQEFATQIQPSLRGAGFEMLGGANLAPPVVPHRNDGSKLFGTRDFLPRQNHSDPYDGLIGLFPGRSTTDRTAPAASTEVHSSSSQLNTHGTPNIIQHTSPNKSLPGPSKNHSEGIVDLISASTSKSPSPAGLQLDESPKDTTETQIPRKRTAMRFKSRSWANICMHAPRRSGYTCPHGQDSLLRRPESEYRPRPGRTFPSANIPVELLKQLHTNPATELHVAVEDEDVDMEGNISSDEADGDGVASSGAKDDHDDSDDDEIIADWPPTPQKEKNLWDDDLPPESSPLQSSPPVFRPKATSMARNAMWNASQSTSGLRNDTTIEEPLMTPVNGDQEMDIDQPPKTVDTAKLFSSAVRPEAATPEAPQEQNSSNNSLLTLSSDNFRDHSSWSGIERSQVLTRDCVARSPVQTQSSSSGTQSISISIEQSQNASADARLAMKPPPRRLISAVDGADSDLPSEVAGAMAEQQLLDDLKESTHPVSDEVQAPATPIRISDGPSSEHDSPTSSIATRKRREAPDMSPEELREQKVSRFNFTQESPVSQNPALEAAKARQEFLRARKTSKRPVALPAMVALSPSRVEPTPEVAMAENSIEPEIDEEAESGVEDTSLYGEFKRAYPSYTAPVKHFETMCKNLAASCRRGQVLCHPMLWDDYIARSVSDYLVYCQERLFAAEPQDPYDKYYNEQIEGCLHEKKVVTRAKLVEWFGPETLTAPTLPDKRRPKPRASFDRAESAARHSTRGTTENTVRSGSAVIKQEDQVGEKNSLRDTAGKVPKGAEWWRKP